MADSLDQIDFTATMGKSFDSMADALDPPAEEPVEEVTEEEAEPVEAETQPTDEVTEEASDPADTQPVDAPARWSAEDKATFSALPREAQELIAKRERERDAAFTQKTQELADVQRSYSELEQVLGPRRQQFAMDGLSEGQALQQLLAISDYAAQDPAGFIRWFAQARGVDIGQLGEAAAGEEGEYPTDPAISQLHQRLGSLEQYLQGAEQQRRQAEQQHYVNQIEAFRDEVGEDGTPSHPHLETVRKEMAALIRSGAAQTLKHAYDMAVWSNAETRAQMMEAREKARVAEAKAAAARAKKAKGTQVSSRGAPDGKAKRTLEQTMSDAYDRAVARE